MRRPLVRKVIAFILRVTKAHLTHDGGYELQDEDWDVRDERVDKKEEAQKDRVLQSKLLKVCPVCGNTLRWNALALPPNVQCFSGDWSFEMKYPEQPIYVDAEGNVFAKDR